jgi:opacity protein-like surface antigen
MVAVFTMDGIAHAQIKLFDSHFYQDVDPVLKDVERTLKNEKCLTSDDLQALSNKLGAARDELNEGVGALAKAAQDKAIAGDQLQEIYRLVADRQQGIATLLDDIVKYSPCKKLHFIPRLRTAEESGERQQIGRARPGGPAVQLASFNGPFGGVQVGGSFSAVTTNEFFADTGMRTNSFDDRGSGLGGGVNFGWNWQPFNPNIVTGVVVEVNALNDKVQHDLPGGNYIGSITNFNASAKARAGVLVTPTLLLYGQTGISIANQQLKIDFGGPETNESQFVPGYTLGFGAEWKLARNPLPFGRQMSLFAEFDHTWWDTAKLTMPAASPLFNHTWQRESDKVSFGVRVSFSNPTPR